MARPTLASLEARIVVLEAALAAKSAPAPAPTASSPTGTPDAPLYKSKKRPCPVAGCTHAPMGPTGLAWHVKNIHER